MDPKKDAPPDQSLPARPDLAGRRDWETLQEDPGQSKTDRLRIQQGWLYRSSTPAGVAMVFVPALNE